MKCARIFPAGLASFVLLLLIVLPGSAQAQSQPEVDLHDLTWFVHVDLIDAGAGRTLAWWSDQITDSVNRGNRLLEGRSGPTDNVCCTKLTSSVAVSTFGTPGDGLDIVDSLADQNVIAATGLPGSRAFLVDSLTYCNGSSPGAIGCAVLPSCSGNGNDDPNLWMYVTVDAFDDGTLPSVIAHERGHNACLQHVATPKCALMQATVFTPGLGGCMTTSECTNMRNARTQTSSGEFCGCHDGAGQPLADGAPCDANSGICSGGCCGSTTGDAGVSLIAAADPGDGSLLIPDDALRIQGYTGDWEDLGAFGSGASVQGLAYSTDADILYGIVPSSGIDRLYQIDPSTGDIVGAPLGEIDNGAYEFISLAYDPGPTSATSDDRLLGLRVISSGSSTTGQVHSIDPAAPNTSTLLGSLGFQPAALFSGLAFDPVQNKLFFATPFASVNPTTGASFMGLWETDMTACPPSCVPSQLPGPAPFVLGPFWRNASLSYSADTGQLYAVGTAFDFPNERTFFNSLDPTDGTSVETLSLDRFTPAGLAAMPEPGFGVGLAVGLGGLAWSRRRRG